MKIIELLTPWVIVFIHKIGNDEVLLFIFDILCLVAFAVYLFTVSYLYHAVIRRLEKDEPISR